jgi:hypothetical protein
LADSELIKPSLPGEFESIAATLNNQIQ